MGLDVISATCYPDNPASRRVLEKCGFRYEGVLHRRELLYNGVVKDHLHFYLTHEMAGFAGGNGIRICKNCPRHRRRCPMILHKNCGKRKNPVIFSKNML